MKLIIAIGKSLSIPENLMKLIIAIGKSLSIPENLMKLIIAIGKSLSIPENLMKAMIGIYSLWVFLKIEYSICKNKLTLIKLGWLVILILNKTK